MANLSMHRSILLALAFCLCSALLIAVPLVHGGVPAHHSLGAARRSASRVRPAARKLLLSANRVLAVSKLF